MDCVVRGGLRGTKEGDEAAELADASLWRTKASSCVTDLADLAAGGDEASLLSDELFRMRLTD